MTDLKPCPFCGSERIRHATVHPGQLQDPYDVVMCDACGGNTRNPDGEEAKKKWNTRAPADRLRKAVGAYLRAELAGDGKATFIAHNELIDAHDALVED